MKNEKLVSDDYPTPDYYNESKKKLVSYLLDHLLTSIENKEEYERLVSILNRPLTLSKNDKRIMYCIKNLGPCYQRELYRFVGNNAFFYIQRLVSYDLLTSKISGQNLEVVKIKSKLEGSQGIGEHQKNQRIYYDISPEFVDLAGRHKLMGDLLFGNEEELGIDFLSKVGEYKEQLEVVLEQIKARQRHEQEAKEQALIEDKKRARQEAKAEKKRQEQLSEIEKRLRKFRSRAAALEYLGKVSDKSKDPELGVGIKRLWDTNKHNFSDDGGKAT